MPKRLTDAVGTQHRPAREPVRIVSLVPSITECLCDLDLREQLVGRTGFCVHPEAKVRKIPKVGGTKDVDLEQVRALAPSHVIVNIDENTQQTATALKDFVPHLVVTHPQSPEDNMALYSLLGGLFNRDTEATELKNSLREALAQINGGIEFAKRHVLYLIWRKPWMTVSRETYISRMLDLVNWCTLPTNASQRYPEITLDAFRGKVDLALLSSEPYPFRPRHLARVQSALGPETDVQLIAGDMLSWYGSRAVQGIRYLQSFARTYDESKPI